MHDQNRPLCGKTTEMRGNPVYRTTEYSVQASLEIVVGCLDIDDNPIFASTEGNQCENMVNVL